MTAAAQKNIDWTRLLALFDRPAPMAPAVQAAAPTVRIAVAQDEAFCFTYAETLESLRAAGAELCYFSPLRDAALPEHIGGLYLPGGYPELYAAQLAANTAMRCAINAAVQRGLPTVAECGGFLYLGQTLEDDAGTAHPMAGVLPGQGFRRGGWCALAMPRLRPQADSMLFRAGERCPCMSSTIGIPPATAPAFAAAKSQRPPLGLRLCQRASVCGVPASIFGMGGHGRCRGALWRPRRTLPTRGTGTNDRT